MHRFCVEVANQFCSHPLSLCSASLPILWGTYAFRNRARESWTPLQRGERERNDCGIAGRKEGNQKTTSCTDKSKVSTTAEWGTEEAMRRTFKQQPSHPLETPPRSAHHRIPSSASPAPHNVHEVAQLGFLTLVDLLHRLRVRVRWKTQSETASCDREGSVGEEREVETHLPLCYELVNADLLAREVGEDLSTRRGIREGEETSVDSAENEKGRGSKRTSTESTRPDSSHATPQHGSTPPWDSSHASNSTRSAPSTNRR